MQINNLITLIVSSFRKDILSRTEEKAFKEFCE
jgi:hypothetical protein